MLFFRGLGEDDSWKKPEAKYLEILSLSETVEPARLPAQLVGDGDKWIETVCGEYCAD